MSIARKTTKRDGESAKDSVIRSITPSDLGRVAQLVREAFDYDSSLTKEMIRSRIFGDPDYDPALSLARIVGDGIASFVIASLPKADNPGKIGWIKIVATAERYRRKGYAGELMNRLLKEMRSRGVREIRVSDRPHWHFWPGVDLRYEEGLEFLEGLGFARDGEAVDYVYDLRNFRYPLRVRKKKQELESDGMRFRRATKSDLNAVGEWIEKHFSKFWRLETSEAFRSDPSDVVIAETRRGKSGEAEIVGFATVNGAAKGRFGPTGVAERMRGKGVGVVLLFDAFQLLKEEGVSEAVVHWTDHLFFYTQVPGLSGVRHYWIMKKKVS
jgi:GNAT superfamily N-acetyltransferase